MKEAGGFDRFKSVQRKAVRVSDQELVKTGYMNEQRFPWVIEPNVEGLSLVSWAGNHREMLDEALNREGAILFRGFGIDPLGGLEQFVEATSGAALKYTERSSPRSQVQGRVYTSTDHPPSQTIFLHNEQSYSLIFPLRILFACVTAAEQGGETPIANCRNVLAHLRPEVRRKFEELGYMYVRNFGDGFGLPWQEAFQTEDPTAVEAYCQANEIEFEWKSDNRLRTRQVRRALAIHPKSGVPVWFNHLTFFHVSTLEEPVRGSLLSEFAEEDLPNNTYYGDGSPIEPEVLEELRAAYHRETIAFPWQRGDLLLLDNMLTAHGRAPFGGPRKIVVAMAEPYRWADIAR